MTPLHLALVALVYLTPQLGGLTPAPDAPITLAWDETDAAATGFIVERGDACGAWTVTADAGPAQTYTWPTTAFSVHIPSCFAVKAYDATGTMSDDSVSLQFVPTTPPDPRCDAITGDRHVSVFVTTWTNTTGNAGSKARIDMQVASLGSPITALNVYLDAEAVVPATAVLGQDLGALAGVWFTLPTTAGSYPLTLEAVNAYGCRATMAHDALGRAMIAVVK